MITFTTVFALLWNNVQAGKSFLRMYTDRTCKALNVVFAVLSVFPMYFVNAFMKYVGGDYGNYYQYYKKIISGGDQQVDIAYKVICLFVNRMGLDFQWVYYILCFISYSILTVCIYKYSKNYMISYVMFFFDGYFALLGLNQIRQFVAVVLVLWSYQYLESKESLKYFTVIGIACTFHFTAIIMVPCYFILNRKWNLSFFTIVALIMLPFNFIFNKVLVWLFATFLPRYLNTNFATREFKLDVPYLMMILITFLISIVFENRDIKYLSIFKNCMYLSVIIALFGSWLPDYKRFIYYFFISSIVYVPTLLEKGKNMIKKWGAFLLVMLVYILYYLYASPNWFIYPYRSIWG
ncbi:MAG: EpsG family protein [Bariatricus sp.]|nr:EpsG family protein [Bariatricus sp.]